MAKSILHVVPHESGWAVKREGVERVNSTHSTQKDAIESARELAKEQDDIVIHRPDGTIRERVTYSGSNGNDSTGEANRSDRDDSRRNDTRRDEPHPRDYTSVGTRVRWGAVFAGAVVAMALYVMLSLLANAIGLTAIDSMTPRSFTITAAIIAAVILIATMFLGGFIASRFTVGEEPSEAMTYGVLVWGTLLLFLLVTGAGLGVGAFAGLKQAAPDTAATGDVQAMKRELGLTDQQADKYQAYVQNVRATAERTNPATVAWWTFGGVALSLLAAVGGGLVGAGPEMFIRAVREPRRTAVVVPHPA